MTTVRLASISLEEPLSDSTDRSVMPMSTVIASAMWLIEANWDGKTVGDPQIYRNMSCGPTGARLVDDAGAPLPDKWEWWAGVPCGKVKAYKFLDTYRPLPQTVLELPFELPHGERKAKPGQAGKGSPPAA